MVRYALLVVIVLSLAAAVQADVIGWECASDGDGAVECIASWQEVGEEYDLLIAGDQYWAPGHILGSFTTDTPLDPTVRIRNTIDNDTTYAWSAYHIEIVMGNPFTISVPTVYSPGDWVGVITQQPALQIDGRYLGILDYTAGTAVAPGDTLDISYKIAFDGSTSYTYCQTLHPVPEPATMSLVLLGGLAMLRRRSR